VSKEDTIQAVADRLMDLVTGDDDVVEELIEDYAAAHDLTPLRPHPVKVENKHWDDLEVEDQIVLAQYHRYEEMQREIIVSAWFRFIAKLAEDAADIIAKMTMVEGERR
jgi:hypothetical protein